MANGRMLIVAVFGPPPPPTSAAAGAPPLISVSRILPWLVVGPAAAPPRFEPENTKVPLPKKAAPLRRKLAIVNCVDEPVRPDVFARIVVAPAPVRVPIAWVWKFVPELLINCTKPL